MVSSFDIIYRRYTKLCVLRRRRTQKSHNLVENSQPIEKVITLFKSCNPSEMSQLFGKFAIL